MSTDSTEFTESVKVTVISFLRFLISYERPLGKQSSYVTLLKLMWFISTADEAQVDKISQ